jgi:hypothetical protein
MSVIAEAGHSPEEFLETRGIDGVSADEVEARIDGSARRDAHDAIGGVLAVEGDLVEVSVAGIDGSDGGLAVPGVAERLREDVRGKRGDDADVDRWVEIELGARGAAVDGGRVSARVGGVGVGRVVDRERLLEQGEHAERFVEGRLDAQATGELAGLRLLERLCVGAELRARGTVHAWRMRVGETGLVKREVDGGVDALGAAGLQRADGATGDRIGLVARTIATDDAVVPVTVAAVAVVMGVVSVGCTRHGEKCTLPPCSNCSRTNAACLAR